MVAALARHDVADVLIGALAAVLHGSPLRTGDPDITPERSQANLERHAAVLGDLDARIWAPSKPQGLAFDGGAEALARADMWNFVTRCGRLDISFPPSGTRGLRRPGALGRALRERRVKVPVASLLDIIRSKEAAGPDKDRATLRKLAAHIADEERRGSPA